MEAAELGDVLVGAVAVDFDLRQPRLNPAELPVGQVDLTRASARWLSMASNHVAARPAAQRGHAPLGRAEPGN
jgi:hypothetical protein